MGLLLDTHYWIWYQTGNSSEIKPQGRDLLIEAQRKNQLFLAAASIWEVARLVADGRIDLHTSVDDFVEEALNAVQLLPLTTKVLIESTRLPGEIHRDPADRLLVATARENSLTLVTRDKNLLAYGRSGHLRTAKF